MLIFGIITGVAIAVASIIIAILVIIAHKRKSKIEQAILESKSQKEALAQIEPTVLVDKPFIIEPNLPKDEPVKVVKTVVTKTTKVDTKPAVKQDSAPVKKASVKAKKTTKTKELTMDDVIKATKKKTTTTKKSTVKKSVESK